MQIVINGCFGGFGLSHPAVMRYGKLKGWGLHAYVNTPPDFENLVPYDGISRAFCVHYGTKPAVKGKLSNKDYFYPSGIKRTDPDLIRIVRKMGKRANGDYADLKIITIPDDVEWEIQEYEGREWVAEKHRRWE